MSKIRYETFVGNPAGKDYIDCTPTTKMANPAIIVGFNGDAKAWPDGYVKSSSADAATNTIRFTLSEVKNSPIRINFWYVSS